MNKKLLLFAVIAVCIASLTQAQSYIQAYNYGTAGNDIARSVCTDGSGNVYTTGYYRDSITFGTMVLHASNQDAFIVKYDPSGSVVWAKRVTGNGVEQGFAVKTDAAGNVYVAGTYSDSARFDALSAGTSGATDMFLLKLNSSGTGIWLKSFGSSGNNDRVGGMALDGSGNIYITGEYSGTCQFGNSVTLVSVNHPVNGGSIDVLTAKFNNSGIAQWARSGGGIGTDRGYDIDVDASGNSYLTGFISNTATFSGATLTQNGSVEIFVAGYNASGSLQLLFKAGSSGYEAGYGIALDGSGHFYITGLHDGNTLFDTITAIPNGSYDMFLARYSVAGDVQWVRSTVSTQWEHGNSVDVDDKGNVYVGAALYHNGTSMFSEMNMNSAGYYDAVVVKYNRHGEFQWAVRGGTYDYDEVLELAVADSGKVYAAGYFGGSTSSPITATFGTFSFPGSGGNDIFLTKLRTDITTGQVNLSSYCAGQAVTVPFQVHTVTMAPGNVFTAQLSDASGRFANAVNIGTLNSAAASGIINALIPDSMGEGAAYRIRVISSDSARVGSDNGTDIIIHSLPAAEITSAGNEFCSGDSLTLTATAGPGYTYAWLKAFVPITGALSQVYQAKTTGVYNVIVSNQFGCNRTSSSLSVIKRPYPTATITAAGPTTFCAGSNVQLNAATGNNYTYKWKKGANFITGATNPSLIVTAGGTYKCVVTSQYGCSLTSNKIVVSTYALPAAVITAQGPTTFCPGDSVVLVANSGAGLTYQWKKYANYVPGATGVSYTASITGNYKAVVTNANGCSKASNAILVTASCRIAVENNLDVEQLEVYPIPADDHFNIEMNSENKTYSFTLLNTIGQTVREFELAATGEAIKIEVPCEELKPGIYLLQVTADGFRRSIRVVKR